MPLFLTSLSFDGLGEWLGTHAEPGPVVLITSASRALPDGDAIVEPALAALQPLGRAVRQLDVSREDPEPLNTAAAVLMTGGDPFALLAALVGSGVDALLRDAHRRGLPIAGQSAGAMVCGPNLAPARITSPFTASADLGLAGLGLIPRLVLPHHDRPGRAALHRRAARAVQPTPALLPLWDDEVLLQDGDTWCILRRDRRTRVATPADAGGVAAVYHAASREAWAPFLGADRLARAVPDPDRWAERISEAGERFLVTENADGISGFVRWCPAADPDLDPGYGEVALLYTHPRTWGDGSGRRLLERATWALWCEGDDRAVLWTEERNERALAVYRANGWRLQGASRERDYLGVPIRELRHVIDLSDHAGGG